MQCHVEMTEPLVTDWITTGSMIFWKTPSRQGFETIYSKIRQSIPKLNQVADVSALD